MRPLPAFPEFFRALWEIEPFPWQTRLAEQVRDGEWPEWITLPTGTGKTSVLDIAVYALACQAERPATQRSAPVRIVFAVNRRIVVDEAFVRARILATRLKAAAEEPSSLLHPFAAALKLLADDPVAPPLEAFPLRGGTFSDRSWARSAFQPLVLSTTLDQLGSRLLFRGYGVSEYARPIHAALVSNDALLILDEAHTATAFSQTLQGIARLREEASEKLGLPFRAVQLTATPPPNASEPYRLSPADEAHPVIASRLRASKPVEMIEVSGAVGKQRHKKLAEAMAGKANEFLNEGHRRVLIVVNRVATAEALLDALKPKLGKDKDKIRAEILTGRLRPLDRDQLVESLTTVHQLKSSAPNADVPPLILIATQCIEVGADFDFDALLTELAPLDSLRQRFGRLNRYGRERVSPAAIFAPEESITKGGEDAIYGDCLPVVWPWLGSLKNPDFGLSELAPQLPGDDEIVTMLAPTSEAPVLIAPHLDLLCQTSPEPHVSPDPSLYIHGSRREFPEIGVILREDLDEFTDPLNALRIARPIATEAASVPLYLARRWLSNSKDFEDETGDAPMSEISVKKPEGFVPVPIWRRGEAEWLTNPLNLRSGDILVLSPSRRESLANLLPLPDGVNDQYESAHLAARDRLAIRLGRKQREDLALALPEDSREEFLRLTAPCFEPRDDQERWEFDPRIWKETLPAIFQCLARHLPAQHPQRRLWRFAACVDADDETVVEKRTPRPIDDWKVVPYLDPDYPGVIATNFSRCGATLWPLEPDDLGSQGNEAMNPVTLDSHSLGVALRVNQNASPLEEPLRRCLTLAARLHDIGKLDPRFQALLHGCYLHAVAGREVLAKSGNPAHPIRDARLREALLLPPGFRHELLSAKIAAESESLRTEPERELLLHLIASHHGRCRGFAPVILDELPEPFEVQVGELNATCPGYRTPLASVQEGVPRRFWALTRRFGWWGLPYLESLLRLADQAESANPSQP